jgi:deoxyribodipyrimidine photolyase-related protein
MKTVLWLQDSQLSRPFVENCQLDKRRDVVVLMEVAERMTWHHYHKQKIVLILSAVRHFAGELRDAGYQVEMYTAPTFVAGCAAVIESDWYNEPVRWLVPLPTDWDWRQKIETALRTTLPSFDCVSLHEEDFLFYVPYHEWSERLSKNKKWKLEPVYEALRREFAIFMDGGQPLGGKWNYDVENRKPAKAVDRFIEPLLFPPDELTKAIIAEVEVTYRDHPGRLTTFIWPVTRAQALQSLHHFIDNRLADFGDFQDAMISGQPFMAHSLLSASVNLGLLHPHEAITAAEQAYRAGRAPLAATEGFIRQILGWREYVRGVYIAAGPAYKTRNTFHHERPLPALYWGAPTDMNCLRTTVDELLESGYSHHIQRLMILCNFALLAGLEPHAVNDWFNQMYVDSYDWVVTPNVIGMGLHADGGMMSTKPYISSAQYIKKMSDYCNSCTYRPDVRHGDTACPFNALYWSFIQRTETQLAGNRRMQMMQAVWRKFSADEKTVIAAHAAQLLSKLEQDSL